MQPVFFGSSAQPLYGVLTPATARPRRKTGVLLLYPGVQEYSRAHWAFRTLAGALAARGFCALRFDYRGVGDSAGDPDSTTVDACVDDACVAASELRDAGAVDQVAIIGMRLGAAVGAHACERLPFVDRVFLWNPVVDGRAYVRELEHMDRAMRLRLLHPLEHREDELAGFRFPSHVRRSLERVDLCSGSAPLARGVEVFAEPGSSESAALREAASRRGHQVVTHTIHDSGGPPPFPDASLLAQEAIASLVARMDEVAP
jgi:alpha-beta hydrolase superfamily lysophospholipase